MYFPLTFGIGISRDPPHMCGVTNPIKELPSLYRFFGIVRPLHPRLKETIIMEDYTSIHLG